MYDFHFGSPDKIDAQQEDYLIFVKRLLPRWCNSIPDSEFLALHDTLKGLPDKSPVILETGCGASTIVLVNAAMRRGGQVISWDINPSKGAFLRSVINDTLVPHYGIDVWKAWRFVPFSSLSPHLGISITGELGIKANAVFIDSEHTLNTVLAELRAAMPFLADGAYVILDDANYSDKYMNPAYINMQRAKLGLPPVDNPPDNVCRLFHIEVAEELEKHWHTVEKQDDLYKKTYQDDPFWHWYSADRLAMAEKGMEKTDLLDHRYDAWQVSRRR